MKRLFKLQILVCSVIAVCLIALLAVIIITGRTPFNIDFKGVTDLKQVNIQKVSLKEITGITLKYQSDDIVFYTSDEDELILKEFMNFTPDEDELTQITNSNGKLVLKGQKDRTNNWMLGGNKSSRMEIYLPLNYHGSLNARTSSGCIDTEVILHVQDFAADSSSGDITMNEVYADNILATASSGCITFQKAEGLREFTSSSGDIEIHGGSGNTTASSSSGCITIENTSGELSADSSSGDIKVKKSNGKKDISSTSGQIEIEDADGFIKASASSGDISVADFEGAGDFETTAGSIKIDYRAAAEVNEDINVETSSGDVQITLPHALAFQFEAETSSGDIETYFDDKLDFDRNNRTAAGAVGSNPAILIDISTTSGIIKMNSR